MLQTKLCLILDISSEVRVDFEFMLNEDIFQG